MRAPLTSLFVSRWSCSRCTTGRCSAPPRYPAQPRSVEAATLRDIEASRVAFTAERYADALEPTERLTLQFPTQAVYFDRLARIQHGLGRPQREARAWEGVFRTSPTPENACPMLARPTTRIPDPVRALDAYERCVQVSPARSRPAALPGARL